VNITILTEGGKDTGFGHLTRCISLSEAFEEKGIYPEFIINGDCSAGDILKDKNNDIYDWSKEEIKLINGLNETDILIVDSILIEDELLHEISELVKTIVYIDDFKRRRHAKGIVIDWTVLADTLNYHDQNDGVLYLLGITFTALRKEFWEVKDKEIKKDVESILITFGGSDTENITPKVLSLLINNYTDINKKVIIGKGFSNVKEIEQIADGRVELIYYPDAQSAKENMLDADVAIAAGGQTLYELARVGVPTIAILVNDNQLDDVCGWEKTGFIDYAGWYNENKTYENVLSFLTGLLDYDIRFKKSEIGKKYVDGKGAKRIVNEILNFTGLT